MAVSLGSDVGLPKHDRPKHAYFKLYVGEDVDAAIAIEWDTGKPQIYQGVEVTKIGNAGTTVQMVLFDDNWTELETLFQQRSDISFEYGYVDGPRSDRYKMILTTYTIDVKFTGILLHIEAVSQSAYDNLKTQITEPLGNNPTEAIRKICEEKLGYQIADDDFLSSDDVSPNELGEEYSFSLTNDNAISYIITSIVPLALHDNKPLVFWVDDETDPPTAHLGLKHPLEAANGYKTYIYARGYNSTVISVNFQMKGVFGGMEGGGLYFTTKSSSHSISLADKEESETATSDIDVGEHAENLVVEQSMSATDLTGDTKEVAERKLQYSAINMLDEAAIATVTILGDPTLELLDYVNLMIVQDDHKLYHLSGIYQIIGLIDTVENGKYITTMRLIHAGWFSPQEERSIQQHIADDEGIDLVVEEMMNEGVMING